MRALGLVRAAVFAGALLAPALAAAQGAVTYSETIAVAADGSARVRATVDSAAGFADAIVIRAIGQPSNVASDATDVPVRVDRRGGDPCLVIGGAPGASRHASISYDSARFLDMDLPPLAHGNRRLLYGFENLADARVDSFTGTIIFPPDVVVTSVDDVRPAVGDATVELPYRLGADAGRRTLVLTRKALSLGDDVQVTLRIKRQGSALALFVIAGVLGALYLLTFRDLIHPRATRGSEAL